MAYRTGEPYRQGGGGLVRMFSTKDLAMGQLVEKATSELLIGPDWGMNMELCDSLNGEPSQVKGAIKTLRKRLANKNTQVQHLSLTLLETLVKNCGEFVHANVAESDILPEMVKIVRKKADMSVRDRVLELLDSWQEAFGGPNGRYRQYWQAYNEVRSTGADFPARSTTRTAPVFTPPRTAGPPPMHSGLSYPTPSYSLPAYGSPLETGLSGGYSQDEGNMSPGEMANLRSRCEVLSEMLSALSPSDRQAVKEELITELVEQVRSAQGRVTALVNSTADEELLRHGLTLNDDMQKVLSKYEEIASGSAMVESEAASSSPRLGRFRHEDEVEDDNLGRLAPRATARERLQGTSNSTSEAQVLPPPSPPGSLKDDVDHLSAEVRRLPTPGVESHLPSMLNLPPIRFDNPTPLQDHSQSLAFAQEGSAAVAPYEAPLAQGTSQPPNYNQPPSSISHQFNMPQQPQQARQAPAPFLQYQQQQPSHYTPQPVPVSYFSATTTPTSASFAGSSFPRALGGAIRPIPGPPSGGTSARTLRQIPPYEPVISNPFEEEAASFGSSPTFVATPDPVLNVESTRPSSQGVGLQFSNNISAATSTEGQYVAPWAMASSQPMTNQQRALVYGQQDQQPSQQQQSVGLPPSSQQLDQQAPYTQPIQQLRPSFGLDNSVSHMPPPVHQTMSPQQRALLYGNSGNPPLDLQASSPPTITQLALPPPPNLIAQRQQYFHQQQQLASPSSPPDNRRASFPLDQGMGSVGSTNKVGGKVTQQLPLTPTPQQLAKNQNPVNDLFGDLVDLSSVKVKLGPGRGMRA